VTEAHVCEQLALGRYVKAERTAEIRTRDLLSRNSNALTATPPGHTVYITIDRYHFKESMNPYIAKNSRCALIR